MATNVFLGPQLTTPRVSLVTASEVVTIPEDDEGRWFNGFYVIPDGCPDYGTYAVCPPEDAAAKESADNVENPEYFPYVVYATDKCSTFGNAIVGTRDFWGRAERKLNVATTWVMERELWADTLGLGNPHLADSTVTTTTTTEPVNPVDGLALMEQALADANVPRGMIHVRPSILTYLQADKAIRREGNLWLTAMDNIVVGGRGYPGTGPDGEAPTDETEWMYASAGIVQIRMAREKVYLPRRIFPDESQAEYEASLREAINRQTNDIDVYVEQVVHAALDQSCGVWAAEILGCECSNGS